MVTRSSNISTMMNLAYTPTGEDIYTAIKAVADSIDAVNAVAAGDLQALITAWDEAKDFTGITVVSGEVAGWDSVNRVLTVPTVKGDTGNDGERGLPGPEGPQGIRGLIGPQGLPGDDITMDSITVVGDGTFIWNFSDGTSFTTPDLRGSKGDTGDTGIGVDHVKATSTTEPHGDFAVASERDTYTLYGDADETINLGSFTVINGLASDDVFGIMYRSTYDTDSSGVVDNSERLGGKDLATVEAERDAAILAATLNLGTNYTVANHTEKDALTNLTVGDKVFVTDDGDTKWAQYWITAVTDGQGSTSTFEVVMDEDTYLNANTAAGILTAIKTVDGAGSGLDADTLDGQEGSFYQDRLNHTGTQTLATISDAGTAASKDVTTAPTDTTAGRLLKVGDDAGLLSNNGRKNYVINGGFDIWQRGVIFTDSTDLYTADRWIYTGIATNTVHVAIQPTGITFPDGTPASRYFVTLNITTAGDNYLRTKLEDVRNFHSKTVTMSCWLRSSVDTNIEGFYLIQNFGSGGTPSAPVAIRGADNTSLQANVWKKVIFTTDLPSISGKTLGLNFDSYLEVRINPNNAYTGNFDIAQVQLEDGSVATPFEQRNYGEELALCQRYYEASENSNLPVTTSFTNGRGFFSFKVTKRVRPTMSYDFDNNHDGTWTTFLVGTDGGYQNTVSSNATGFSFKADAEL